MKNKFKVNELVKHKKGGLYNILQVPCEHRILEDTQETFYVYMDKDAIEWVRSKTQMEDGRFIFWGKADDRK
jgi:hypothetical protein